MNHDYRWECDIGMQGYLGNLRLKYRKLHRATVYNISITLHANLYKAKYLVDRSNCCQVAQQNVFIYQIPCNALISMYRKSYHAN